MTRFIRGPQPCYAGYADEGELDPRDIPLGGWHWESILRRKRGYHDAMEQMPHLRKALSCALPSNNRKGETSVLLATSMTGDLPRLNDRDYDYAVGFATACRHELGVYCTLRVADVAPHLAVVAELGWRGKLMYHLVRLLGDTPAWLHKEPY